MSEISIITPYKGEAKGLYRLSKLLFMQKVQPNKWAVVVDKIEEIDKIKLYFTNQKELFQPIILLNEGKRVYGCINTAINKINPDYYLVCGADDTPYNNCLKSYLELMKSQKRLIYTLPIFIDKKLSVPRFTSFSQDMMFAYISGHSLGSVISKKLHNIIGYYDESYIYGSDQDFIYRASITESIQNNLIAYSDSVIIGEFGTGGISSNNSVKSSLDLVNILCKHKVFSFKIWIFVLTRLIRGLL